MVPVPKKNEKIRICINMKRLNESMLREVYPLPQVDDALAQLTGARIFSKLDARSGFRQNPLAEESWLCLSPHLGDIVLTNFPLAYQVPPNIFKREWVASLRGWRALFV